MRREYSSLIIVALLTMLMTSCKTLKKTTADPAQVSSVAVPESSLLTIAQSDSVKKTVETALGAVANEDLVTPEECDEKEKDDALKLSEPATTKITGQVTVGKDPDPTDEFVQPQKKKVPERKVKNKDDEQVKNKVGTVLASDSHKDEPTNEKEDTVEDDASDRIEEGAEKDDTITPQTETQINDGVNSETIVQTNKTKEKEDFIMGILIFLLILVLVVFVVYVLFSRRKIAKMEEHEKDMLWDLRVKQTRVSKKMEDDMRSEMQSKMGQAMDALKTEKEQALAAMALKEDELAKMNEILAAKENELTRVNEILSAKENELTKMNEALAAKDNEIAEAKRVAEEAQEAAKNAIAEAQNKAAETSEKVTSANAVDNYASINSMKKLLVKKIESAQALLELKGVKKGEVITEEEWVEIRNFLDTMDNQFVSRLKTKFPTLSEKDVDLLALLRMGIPSKNIASVYGINEKSIKQKLFVYKAKVGLENDSMSLRDFIDSF